MTLVSDVNNKLDLVEERYHHGDLRRALIAAALVLLTEKQDWSFSLREVARHAGVSHNAPYNHFSSKQDLLAAVAAEGYETLRAHMQAAAGETSSPAAALKAIGIAYVRFGVGNPAHYRLMFGAVLPPSGSSPAKDGSPSILEQSAAAAKAVLSDVIQRGAKTGRFALSPANIDAINIAVLSAWSLVHGLTVLLLDGLAGVETVSRETVSSPFPAAEHIADQVSQLLLDGLTEKSQF